YDYDEVCLLSECNFRSIPESSLYEDEIAAEPWFSVGPNDVFPEEFINFLGLPPSLRLAFVRRHGDLLEADFWNRIKQQIAQGRQFHVPPYDEFKRLNRAGRTGRAIQSAG
ncbi:MAG: bifunctional isocitrate dehydrogenase kinase/phosphatase, partial [Planctomycetales bacterium]|nr:bifunctional isocitrate dehydrogenase kinase/phosphatase [Planctomycetales bacterium]